MKRILGCNSHFRNACDLFLSSSSHMYNSETASMMLPSMSPVARGSFVHREFPPSFLSPGHVVNGWWWPGWVVLGTN